MVKLMALNPEAVRQGDVHVSPPAPRPASLDGVTVGLLWNDKRGGDVALRRAGRLLQERYDNVKVVPYQGPRGYPRALLEKAFEECDVFVGSTGD